MAPKKILFLFSVDLLSLQELDCKLQPLDAKWGEQRLAIKDAVMCLMPLFESAHGKFPNLIRSVPLAVDLFLNFLLNVYDPLVFLFYEYFILPKILNFNYFLKWFETFRKTCF